MSINTSHDTGNSFGPNGWPGENAGLSEAVLKLSSSTLSVLNQYNNPHPGSDADYGASPVIFTPGGTSNCKTTFVATQNKVSLICNNN